MKLDEFYETYYPFILGTIQKKIRNKRHIEADDMLHDFIIAKMENNAIDEIIEKTVDGDLGFLSKAVTNFVIDQFRKEKTAKYQINKTQEIKAEVLHLSLFEKRQCTEKCLKEIEGIRKIIKGSKLREDVFELWCKDYNIEEIEKDLDLTRKQIYHQKSKIRKIVKDHYAEPLGS